MFPGIAVLLHHAQQLALDKSTPQIPAPISGYIYIPGQIFLFAGKD